MNEKLSEESLKYIIGRLIERALEAKEESSKNKDDLFAAGRNVAYYEMLDMLQSELDARGQVLKEYGLDINLEKKIA